jgi:hypothetical protein
MFGKVEEASCLWPAAGSRFHLAASNVRNVLLLIFPIIGNVLPLNPKQKRVSQ